MSGDEILGGAQRTEIRVGGSALVVTRDDVEGMQEALLAHLRESDLPDRDYLLRMTETAPAWIDDAGVVRIGGWVLQAHASGLQLSYRLPATETVATGFIANLHRDGEAWKVDDVLPQKIRVRR